jgi:hypothetical protein
MIAARARLLLTVYVGTVNAQHTSPRVRCSAARPELADEITHRNRSGGHPLR